MFGSLKIPKKVTAILVYGRPPLAFSGLICAVVVMWTQHPVFYVAGFLFLFLAMLFDLVDGWFAARFEPNEMLAQLADRIMDKTVYSIIFPLVAVGTMWRLTLLAPDPKRLELLNAILILLLCITVLIRDHFAQFMRGFAQRQGSEPEASEFTRLRTIVAAPVGAILYAHAFYVPHAANGRLYGWVSATGNLSLRTLFFIEIIFLIINFGSIAGYCRKYGTLCLDELCLGDVRLRRRILSLFPNALTMMNAAMGLLAVFFAYQGRVREAYLLLMGAAVFDKLDGALARKLGLTEPLPGSESKFNISLGSILDDISDAVSFCIAPAWIFFIVLSDIPDGHTTGSTLRVVAGIYAVFGLARLVYFTLDRTPVPGFFKGMPTPAAALWVTAPLMMLDRAVESTPHMAGFWSIFCIAVMLAAAIAMNLYPVRYLHLGRFMDRHPWFTRISTLMVIISLFTPFFAYVMLLCGFLYLISPLVTWRTAQARTTGLTDAESSSVS